MKFLCGRPGCGKESVATLQIDAVAETVSLVDPKVSRDGVPLCARHADSTTPPMGWAMNDLRSTSKVLGESDQAIVEATPPRVRPRTPQAEPTARAGSSRQPTAKNVADGESAASTGDGAGERSPSRVTPKRSKAKREAAAEAGPESRPSRRREEEEPDSTQELFPWHYEFNEDEPEELQASTPLLSRAFRATVGPPN